jgi:hypothetical protein
MTIIGPCGIMNRDLDDHLDRRIPAILHLWDLCELAVAAQDHGDRSLHLGSWRDLLFVGGFRPQMHRSESALAIAVHLVEITNGSSDTLIEV